MAKIFPCYSLCPLIEQKNFLGLTQDADSDTVLVTANSNIIGRYKVSDPKQLSSWNSKGTITSATVYDEWHGQYVTIFNHNEIRMWTSLDESIDKIKKYKFAEKLIGLLISPKIRKIVVVFKKGIVMYLEKAIEIRKNKFPSSLIKDHENIISSEIICLSEELITIFVVNTSGTTYRIFGTAVDNAGNMIFNISFENSAHNFLGHCILSDKICYFMSVWSDGKLYKDCLVPMKDSIKSNYLTTIDDLNLTDAVVMKMLSLYSIAICAAKKNGILLIIYSVKYNLVQCKQFYENCRNSPQIWNFESKLFIIMGHNLVVVPYIQENQKLSTLIGSNLNQIVPRQKKIISESEISDDLLPELMKKNDNQSIVEIISNHCDISDCMLIELLVWSIKKVELHENILQIILCKYSLNALDALKLRLICTENECLNLLEYIMNNIHSDDNFNLLRWASLMIDTFYQRFVMSDNNSILEKLNIYLINLKKECDFLNEYKELASVISCVKRKKVILNQ